MADNTDILKRLERAAANLTTLEVITRVGPVDVTLHGGKDPDVSIPSANGATAPVLYTRIDILDGDIFNNLDSSFVDGPNKELKAFHAEAVKAGREMVDQRLDFIARLAQELGTSLKQLLLKSPPASPLGLPSQP